MSGYRDDLQAALSRLDQLERELVAARRDAAELDAARAELATLRAENAALRRSQYALPRAALVRLVIGLLLAALASFYLVASWGAADGMPPELALDAGIVAGLGALGAGLVIGFTGPHRAVALTVLGATGALLATKPYVAPVLSTWEGVTRRFSPSSETHMYFLVPGLIALGLTATIAFTTGPRRQA